jgi:hypothetical protein
VAGVPERVAQARLLNSPELRVLLVTAAPERSCRYVLKAAQSVLEEEGVPFGVVSAVALLARLPDGNFVRRHPVAIALDCVARSLPEDFGPWADRYVRAGGVLVASFDAGTRDRRGRFRAVGVLTGVLGVEAITYQRRRAGAYTTGRILILRRDWLEVPPGKTTPESQLLTGYIYGPLTYPIAAAEARQADVLLVADAVTPTGEHVPGVTLRRVGRGWAMFANPPLGHLKSYSDDLLLRLIVQLAVLRLTRLPHLHPSPHALGGLVINWHVDADLDRKAVAIMLERRYLRAGLRPSLHVTAGPFRDRPGDNLGFDACGQGEPLVRAMARYGVVGSHGGWAHNWFSTRLAAGRLSPREIEALIRRNSDCLERITGRRVDEYSAPNGVHPPLVTRILERLGFVAYYYTGDSGSPPTRTFLDGRRVSDRVWAFPVMTFGRVASLTELGRAGVPEAVVDADLRAIADFVVRNRTVRLIYSHPYDVLRYPVAVRRFIERVDTLARQARLEVRPMGEYARFFSRFVRARATFAWKDSVTLRAVVRNPLSVADIPVAVPREYGLVRARADRPVRLYQRIDPTFRYLYTLQPARRLEMEFRLAP